VIPNSVSTVIVNKVEFTQLNKIEFTREKDTIVKLKVNRIGKIGEY
jgi:CRISPR-associated endonuclease Csn1